MTRANPHHGTPTGYRADGCRCEACRAAHRDRRQMERIEHNADRRHCPCSTCVTRRRTERQVHAAVVRRQRDVEAAREAAARQQARKAQRTAAAAARRAALLADLTDPRHGRRSTHIYYGCYCDRCRTAQLDYSRARYQQRRKAA
jgi:hypothetical protein